MDLAGLGASRMVCAAAVREARAPWPLPAGFWAAAVGSRQRELCAGRPGRRSGRESWQRLLGTGQGPAGAQAGEQLTSALLGGAPFADTPYRWGFSNRVRRGWGGGDAGESVIHPTPSLSAGGQKARAVGVCGSHDGYSWTPSPPGPGRSYGSEWLQEVRVTMSCFGSSCAWCPWEYPSPGTLRVGSSAGLGLGDAQNPVSEHPSLTPSCLPHSVSRQGRCGAHHPQGWGLTLAGTTALPAQRGPGSCHLPQRGRGPGGPQRARSRSGWDGQTSGSGCLWGALPPWRKNPHQDGNRSAF